MPRKITSEERFFNNYARIRRAGCTFFTTRCDQCQGIIRIQVDEHLFCWELRHDYCTCDGGYTPYVEAKNYHPDDPLPCPPCWKLWQDMALAEMEGVMHGILAT